MTERLYHDDPYLLDFDAEVVDRFPVGSRHGLVLDRTAFYPTSGGQPHDTGRIEENRVVDCYEADSGCREGPRSTREARDGGATEEVDRVRCLRKLEVSYLPPNAMP